MAAIIFPDSVSVSREDFDKMTVTMAKLIMLLCSGEKFTMTVDYDPERETVEMATAYRSDKNNGSYT